VAGVVDVRRGGRRSFRSLTQAASRSGAASRHAQQREPAASRGGGIGGAAWPCPGQSGSVGTAMTKQAHEESGEAGGAEGGRRAADRRGDEDLRRSSRQQTLPAELLEDPPPTPELRTRVPAPAHGQHPACRRRSALGQLVQLMLSMAGTRSLAGHKYVTERSTLTKKHYDCYQLSSN